MAYRYRPEVLQELERIGLRPTPETDPRKVYDFLKALYTFEIREMKARRRELERVLGPQPLDDYRRGLHALKSRYPLLEMPALYWVDRGG
jgi:hypothetical protein